MVLLRPAVVRQVELRGGGGADADEVEVPLGGRGVGVAAAPAMPAASNASAEGARRGGDEEEAAEEEAGATRRSGSRLAASFELDGSSSSSSTSNSKGPQQHVMRRPLLLHGDGLEGATGRSSSSSWSQSSSFLRARVGRAPFGPSSQQQQDVEQQHGASFGVRERAADDDDRYDEAHAASRTLTDWLS